MGVDAVLDEEPYNWLQRPHAPPGAQFSWSENNQDSVVAVPHAPERAAPLRSVQQPAAPGAQRPPETFRASDTSTTLDELREKIARFDGCALKATAKNLCFYRGAPAARVMIIGEAPGREEDLEGRPFVGRAGKLLDKMLQAIGLSEGDVHITNIVYWRPPGNRTPTAQEALACRPFLERQMELVGPEFLVTLGGPAAKELFGVSEGIMRLRGKWREHAIGSKRIPAIAMLHPAYLLRTPAAKQMAWRDLLALKMRLARPEHGE